MRPQTEVIEALEHVVASKGFISSPLLSKFLRFVVERSLEGSDHFIKEYTVGTEVFGKPFSFNPSQDASVRINAVRLRRHLSNYYQNEGKDAAIRIELPKGTYKPLFVDNTEEALKDKVANIQDAQQPQDFICILPFSGFINLEAVDFSIEGFCEFLSEKLTQFQDVSVMPYSASWSYTKSGGDKTKLAETFGITYYLTGSVEVEKNKLVIATQLFEAKSNTIVWSGVFPDNLQDNSLQTIVDEITSQIVSSLAGYSGFIHFRNFTRHIQAPVLSNKTALAVFWFYHYQAHHSATIFYETIAQLEMALKDDSSCAICNAVLAHLYADSLIYNYQVGPDPLGKAQAYMERALAINPRCQHAFLVKAWIAIFQRNKDAALKCLEECVAINPNSSFFKAVFSLGLALCGEYEQSLAVKAKALKLNPIPTWWMNLPEVFLALKQHEYEKMLFHARKTATPSVIFQHVFEMIALFYLNDLASLQVLIKQYFTRYPQGLDFLSHALPAILFDEELIEKITTALDGIIKMYDSDSVKTIGLS